MKLALRTRDFDSRARAELNARAFLDWLDLFLSGHNCPLPYFVPLTSQSISHVPSTLPDRWRSLTEMPPDVHKFFLFSEHMPKKERRLLRRCKSVQ